MNSIRFSVFALTALLSLSASADRSFSSLEERMSGSEFRETGLHKLTDDELAALNRWVRQRSLAEGERSAVECVQAPDPSSASVDDDQRGLSVPRTDRSTIRSRIVGSFDGWRGRDEFELENGQVWRQAASGTFSVRRVENPEIEISPGMFGAWYLRVDGYNTRVRVERIR